MRLFYTLGLPVMATLVISSYSVFQLQEVFNCLKYSESPSPWHFAPDTISKFNIIKIHLSSFYIWSISLLLFTSTFQYLCNLYLPLGPFPSAMKTRCCLYLTPSIILGLLIWKLLYHQFETTIRILSIEIDTYFNHSTSQNSISCCSWHEYWANWVFSVQSVYWRCRLTNI